MRRSREALSEALVSHLRNRKRRIVTYSIFVILLLGGLAIQCFKLTMMWSFLAPKEGDDLLWHVAMCQPIVVWMATACASTLVLAMVCTYAVVKLIADIFGVTTRDDLLVQIWDRLQALERSQTTPANPQQPQPQGASPLGGSGSRNMIE
jgi:hypothetical protein